MLLVVPTIGQGASPLVAPQALTTRSPVNQLVLAVVEFVAMWSTIATHSTPRGSPRAMQRRATPKAG